MFEDQSNSNIDSSKDVSSSNMDEAAMQDSPAQKDVAADAASGQSHHDEHAMSTADIDIDDLDLETLERLTNPEATEAEIESTLESISVHSDEHNDAAADADTSASAADESEAADADADSTSDSAISFTIESAEESNGNEPSSDADEATASTESTADSTDVSVDLDFEDQPRLKVFDEDDHELSPPVLEPAEESIDITNEDAAAPAADSSASHEQSAAEDSAAYGKDERFDDVNADEAFGVTSDENVEAMLAGLEANEADDSDIDEHADDYATAEAESDSAATDDATAESADAPADDEIAAQVIEEPSETEASTDSSVSANAEEASPAAAEAGVAAPDFVSAATNDDDSFLSDIESALEDSELIEQEMAESVMQESGAHSNYGSTSATLGEDYKITTDSHAHLHQDYEVINPHPAALESAAEAARRFNAMADQADALENGEDYIAGAEIYERPREFDDSELVQAVNEHQIDDNTDPSAYAAEAFATVDGSTNEFHSDDEVVMNNTPSPSDSLTSSDLDSQALSVSETTSSDESTNATEEAAKALGIAVDSTFGLTDSLDDSHMSTADSNNEETTQDNADISAEAAAALGNDANASAVDAATADAATDSPASANAAGDAASDAASSAEAKDDNPFAGLEHVDEQEDDSFDSDLAAQMAAAQEAMAQSLADEAAQKELDNGIQLVSADKFRDDKVSIMSDAQMMSNEGHTAIQGLENRAKAKQAPRKSTNITGLSEEDLATLRHINELNANKRKRHKEAEARFNAQIAAENGLPYDPALLEEPEPVPGEDSTIIFGSAANAATERMAHASENYASQSSSTEEDYADIYSGVAAPINHDNQFGTSGADGLAAAADGIAAGVGGLASAADTASSASSVSDDASAADGLAGLAAAPADDQSYGFGDGIAVQTAASYDEFSTNEGTYSEQNGIYDQGTDQYGNQSAPAADTYSQEGYVTPGGPQDQYAFNQYDENEVQAMPAQRQAEPEDDGPVYYVGPTAKPQAETAPVDTDNIYIGTYAERMARKREAEEAARQAEEAARQAAAYQSEQQAMQAQQMAGSNSLDDETFAAAQNSNGYVAPGHQEPKYYVGPSNPPVTEEAPPAYEPSPYITPGVRTPQELAAEAAEREAAMAKAAEQARLAEQARAQEQARLAAQEQARIAEQQRMTGLSSDSVDEGDLAVPAGMADGGALSMQSAAAADQYSGDSYDSGPQYYVGPKESSAPMQEAQNEAPIYAVGVGHSNAEVEANIQATRSKLQHDRALPPSYLDGDYNEETEGQETETKTAEDIAYEEALAEAARESMAAPHSQVIENARKLAAEQEARYAKQEALRAAQVLEAEKTPGLFGNDFPISGETDGADALSKASGDKMPQESDYENESYETDSRTRIADSSADRADLADGIDRSSAAADEYEQDQADAAYAPRGQWQEQERDDEDVRSGNMRRDENGTANFANLNLQENVGLGMTVFLYLRQLLAAFFTHTTLPIIAPKTAARLGPCYPSSMAVPYLFVGLLAGLVASVSESLIHVDTVGTLSFIVFLLCTGLTPYRGIYRICSYISRRRHDVILVAASITVPMLIFMWLSNILILSANGIAEATAAYGIVAMLSAASASTLTWNLPQDPMDSSGTMTTKGLLFVIVLSIMASFGIMHYITGLSLLALCVAMRLIFGMLIAGNNGTSHRSYVHALQLLTMFILLFDLIILKSQGYNILSVSSLEFINQLRGL